jgi:hypothetical protein
LNASNVSTLLDLLCTQKGCLPNEVGFLQADCSGSGLDALFISTVQAQLLARVHLARRRCGGFACKHTWSPLTQYVRRSAVHVNTPR